MIWLGLRKRVKAGLCLLVPCSFGVLLLVSAHAISGAGIVRDQSTIIELTNWRHPTKAVLERNGITLVELHISNKYPIFRVKFDFDPISSENSRNLNRICYELLEANGMWPYALVDSTDHIRLNVQWRKLKKEMFIEFIPIK